MGFLSLSTHSSFFLVSVGAKDNGLFSHADSPWSLADLVPHNLLPAADCLEARHRQLLNLRSLVVFSAVRQHRNPRDLCLAPGRLSPHQANLQLPGDCLEAPAPRRPPSQHDRCLDRRQQQHHKLQRRVGSLALPRPKLNLSRVEGFSGQRQLNHSRQEVYLAEEQQQPPQQHHPRAAFLEVRAQAHNSLSKQVVYSETRPASLSRQAASLARLLQHNLRRLAGFLVRQPPTRRPLQPPADCLAAPIPEAACLVNHRRSPRAASCMFSLTFLCCLPL